MHTYTFLFLNGWNKIWYFERKKDKISPNFVWWSYFLVFNNLPKVTYQVSIKTLCKKRQRDNSFNLPFVVRKLRKHVLGIRNLWKSNISNDAKDYFWPLKLKICNITDKLKWKFKPFLNLEFFKQLNFYMVLYIYYICLHYLAKCIYIE